MATAEMMQVQEGQAKHSLGQLVYEYRGTVFDGIFMPERRVRSVQGYDDVRSDDVIVCTYPKTGTHWTADIVRKIVHDGDIEKAIQSHADGDISYEIEPPKDFTGKMFGGAKLAVASLEELSALASPRVIVTHLLFDMLPQKVQEGQAKLIYVYRDPRDIAVSMWHQLNDVQKNIGAPALPWEPFLESFMQGKVSCGLWSKHFKSYQEVSCQSYVHVLHYEEMKADLGGTVTALARFLGKDLDVSAIKSIAASCTFEAAKVANPNSPFVRKGIVGGWKTQFKVSQSERFHEHMEKEIAHQKLETPYRPIP